MNKILFCIFFCFLSVPLLSSVSSLSDNDDIIKTFEEFVKLDRDEARIWLAGFCLEQLDKEAYTNASSAFALFELDKFIREKGKYTISDRSKKILNEHRLLSKRKHERKLIRKAYVQ